MGRTRRISECERAAQEAGGRRCRENEFRSRGEESEVDNGKGLERDGWMSVQGRE